MGARILSTPSRIAALTLFAALVALVVTGYLTRGTEPTAAGPAPVRQWSDGDVRQLDALAQEFEARDENGGEGAGTTFFRFSATAATPQQLSALGYSTVVIGKVTESRSFQNEPVDGFPGDIYTDHVFAVERRLTETAAGIPDSVVIRQDGGVTDQEYREILDNPLLRPGRRYLVILSDHEVEATRSVLPITFLELRDGIVREPLLSIGRGGPLARLLVGLREDDAVNRLDGWLKGQ